ncbi:MAG: hypothetical protein EB096_05185 [Betaproteobacteria bacterium]|nr:hypothetical protein [Betaproteobacteria bacterium]NCW39698.1 hypothetical protein [Betaproteobacteria bacterium]NDF64555.1 hypothetical protein [Betaproteobacteria bacterium]
MDIQSKSDKKRNQWFRSTNGLDIDNQYLARSFIGMSGHMTHKNFLLPSKFNLSVMPLIGSRLKTW